MNRKYLNTLKWMGSAALLAGVAACSMMPWADKEDPTVVPFKTIASGSFQGFLKNWDDRRQPVLCALIRTRAEWDHWMQPAAIPGDRRPFGPPVAHFENRQYLVVGRTMPAPDAAERPHVFTPLAVTAREGGLRVSYLFREPASGASYRVKEVMVLSIPKERYTTGTVMFYENEKKVCQLER